MRALSDLEMIDLCERGAGLHPLDRALLALVVAAPDQAGAAADWPLGRRNAALIALRRLCFGPAFAGWVGCPQCGERLEFGFDGDRLFEPAPEPATCGPGYRLPTSRDLASLVGEADARAAAHKLLALCCADLIDVSDDELERLGESMAATDPLAETLLEFSCSSCGHGWRDPFDIAAWLWEEIEARARRVLHDVHTLAQAYGWSEREIVSLSAYRRARYVEMVRS